MSDLHHEAVLAEFNRQVGDVCPNPSVTCESESPYRTADGSCNNINSPAWGMAGSQQRRLIQSAYGK